jgi:hypothetical protein
MQGCLDHGTVMYDKGMDVKHLPPALLQYRVIKNQRDIFDRKAWRESVLPFLTHPAEMTNSRLRVSQYSNRRHCGRSVST